MRTAGKISTLVAAVMLLLTTGLPEPAWAGERIRWSEARVEVSLRDAPRLAALGWEIKERTDGGFSVFLPESELPKLTAGQFSWSLIHSDVEAWYAARAAGAARSALLGGGSMGGYYTATEAFTRMDELVATYPGLIATRVSLGRTHEGRDIWAWKLSANVAVEEPEPTLLLMSLMHAREPEGLMALVYFAEMLLAGYGTEAESTWLLEHREIWLLPVLNADGYAYNEAQAPGGGGMWRKNRRDNGDGSFGVDPNRNFGWEWAHDDSGSSPNPASDVYRGPSPLSEPETQVLRDFVVAQRPIISINTHTFADVLIRPWGYLDALCPDDASFQDVAVEATRATAYKPGNVMQSLGYLANGSHDDYMYGETVSKPRVFGMTPELGNGNDGFWPAPDRIDPIRREAFAQNLAFTWAAGAAPRLVSFVLDDAAPGGDGDGYAERGEIVSLAITVRNRGLGDSLGPVTAKLVSASCALLVDREVSVLGDLPALGTVGNVAAPFVLRVAAGAEEGLLASLTLHLSDAGGDYPPVPLSLLPGQPVTVFSDDFESGLGQWSVSGFATAAAGSGRPGLALTDSASGNYPNDADLAAEIAASFDLSGYTRAWLRFDQRFWIDNDFDAAAVEVLDGGVWRAAAGGSSDTGSGAGIQVVGEPLWDGHLEAWTGERVDLSAWAGSGAAPIRVRFRFRSNASINYDGWFLDDVRLEGFVAGPAPQAPNDPSLLLAVRAGQDVRLAWSAPAGDAAHDPADGYQMYRSDAIRANAGFGPLGTSLSLAMVDAAAAASARSYAYQVVAVNCAGRSPIPPI